MVDFGKRFHPILTIEDYTGFFMAVILGLGITFELPILIFFLSILGIVDAKFLLRHIRYAILVIFVIAAIICPLPDPISMCLFATADARPLPGRRGRCMGLQSSDARKEAKSHETIAAPGARLFRLSLPVLSLFFWHPLPWRRRPQCKAGRSEFSGQAAYDLTKQYLAAAPHRWVGSPDHAKAEEFIKSHFTAEAAKGNFETDSFTASTPAGLLAMKNFIVKYPGKKDGVIVIASHYETNYPLRDINFVGANDGGGHHGAADRARQLSSRASA